MLYIVCLYTLQVEKETHNVPIGVDNVELLLCGEYGVKPLEMLAEHYILFVP